MRLILAFFFTWLFLSGFAAADTSLIKIKFLKYSSEFERRQFEALSAKGEFDAFNFLSCLDSTMTEAKAAKTRVQLDDFFRDKIMPILNNKNQDKALKELFKEVHDKLLKKYVSNVRFDRLLEEGEYNCVTASALYAMAFEKGHIPYQIRSTVNHVYVIANPGKDQMLIETTDPINGTFKYSESYKKNYVEAMVREKMIAKSEFDSEPLETLFQKYFFKSDTITLKELIGYHYYNHGITFSDAESYDEACNQLMKAYYMNNNKQIEHLLSTALLNYINASLDITNQRDLDLYFLYKKIAKTASYDYLYSKYVIAAEDLAITHDNLKDFETISQIILNQLADRKDIDRFHQVYYMMRASNFGLKKDPVNGYENALLAYCINPKDLRIKGVFEQFDNTVVQYFYDLPESTQDSIEDAIKRCAKNCSEEFVNRKNVEIAFSRAKVQFMGKNFSKGDALLAHAEELIRKNNVPEVNSDNLAQAYGEAYWKCYSAYDFDKAKAYVKRGLKIDSANVALKKDLEEINSYKNIIGNNKPSNNFFPPPPPPPPYSSPKSSGQFVPTKPRTVIVKSGSK